MPLPGVSTYLRWAGLGLVALLALGSCRRVAPYPQADSGSDGRLGDARQEGPTIDVSSRIDLSRHDTASPDLLAPDLLAPDLLAPDLLAPDLLAPDISCTTPTFVHTDCAKPCATPAGDQDCDGLPNGRDPKPAACQPLLLNEDFAIDPVKQPARWMVNLPNNVSWSCGQAALAANTRLTLADPQLLASTTAGAYLVETRFTLGAAADPKNWSVAIRVGLSSGTDFNCELWMSTQYANGKPPGAHLNIKACGTDSGTWDQNAPGLGKGTVGETYILQFWYDGTARCRVLRDDGSLQSEKNYFTCAVSRPDTFYVFARSRAVTFHHVRAFAFPN